MKEDGNVHINKKHVERSTESDETKVDPHLQIMLLLLMEDRVNILTTKLVNSRSRINIGVTYIYLSYMFLNFFYDNAVKTV
jgi:hypothetical protein